MATTALFDPTVSGHHPVADALQGAARLVVCTALPLGAFGLVTLLSASLQVFPIFFSPFGLPHWGGAMVHLLQLALLGAAFWAVTESRAHTPARLWLVGLTGLHIALPFATPFLDGLQLGLVCTSLFLVALATLRRVGAVSAMAGWMVGPLVAFSGLSAVLGLTMAAAYTPPFALTQTGNAHAAA